MRRHLRPETRVVLRHRLLQAAKSGDAKAKTGAIETLKFMTVAGVPAGDRLAAFTCSGGEALMVADYCDRIDLALPQPSETVSLCDNAVLSLLPRLPE